jgi:hypothetical protein
MGYHHQISLQLAVDKYITEKENDSLLLLPLRSLVSFEIRNMFNAVFHELLWKIISEKFPSLEAFADVIYKETGETSVSVRLENGE